MINKIKKIFGRFAKPKDDKRPVVSLDIYKQRGHYGGGGYYVSFSLNDGENSRKKAFHICRKKYSTKNFEFLFAEHSRPERSSHESEYSGTKVIYKS